MMRNIGKKTAGIFIATAIAIGCLVSSDEMLSYRLKVFARQAIFGRHTSKQMYQEELQQKSIEGWKNNPNQAEFLRKNPGFLEAHPEFR
jgi:hypothetical protein